MSGPKAVTAFGPDTHPSCLHLTSNQQLAVTVTAFGPDTHPSFLFNFQPAVGSDSYSLRSGHSSILPALNFQPAIGSDSYSLRSGHSSILPALNFQPSVGSDSYSLLSGHSSNLNKKLQNSHSTNFGAR